ncbi:MAG: 3'-5' exonuclease [Planctomycetota bacterium]
MNEVILFDLEFTAWEGSQNRNWSGTDEHREIVQIGALCLDTENLLELATFERLVQPRINPRLSTYFTDLTGISNEDVQVSGVPFAHAFQDFLDFASARCFFCYGTDEDVLRENLLLNKMFLTGLPMVHDLRNWFRGHGVDVENVNSGHLTNALGCQTPVNHREHNALSDCRSILNAVKFIVSSGAPTPF